MEEARRFQEDAEALLRQEEGQKRQKQRGHGRTREPELVQRALASRSRDRPADRAVVGGCSQELGRTRQGEPKRRRMEASMSRSGSARPERLAKVDAAERREEPLGEVQSLSTLLHMGVVSPSRRDKGDMTIGSRDGGGAQRAKARENSAPRRGRGDKPEDARPGEPSSTKRASQEDRQERARRLKKCVERAQPKSKPSRSRDSSPPTAKERTARGKSPRPVKKQSEAADPPKRKSPSWSPGANRRPQSSTPERKKIRSEGRRGEKRRSQKRRSRQRSRSASSKRRRTRSRSRSYNRKDRDRKDRAAERNRGGERREPHRSNRSRLSRSRRSCGRSREERLGRAVPFSFGRRKVGGRSVADMMMRAKAKADEAVMQANEKSRRMLLRRAASTALDVSFFGKGKGKGEAMGKGASKGGFPRGAEPGKVGPEGAWEIPRAQAGLQLVGENAQSKVGVAWTYPVIDESRRCYVGFLQNSLPQERLQAFYESIKTGTEWLQPEGKLGPIPRKTAWMVAPGCTCSYRYGGLTVPPNVWPQWMVELMTIYMPYCGITTPEAWPNCCNLNLYESGGFSVGWHADDEPLFQGKFQDITVISLSLGQTRRFELKLLFPDEREKPTFRMNLASGDLCTMEGMVQKHMHHRVPREAGVDGARINLTWRWVKKHDPSCPIQRRR